MSYKKTRPNYQGKTRRRQITDSDIPVLAAQLQDDILAMVERYQKETGICINNVEIDWNEFTSVGGYLQHQTARIAARGKRCINGNFEETWVGGTKVEVVPKSQIHHVGLPKSFLQRLVQR